MFHSHYVAEKNDLSVEEAKMVFEANYPLFDKDRKHVLDDIKDLIVTSNRNGLLIFLASSGGTGKTFTLNVPVTWMITQSLKVATSTASGIAATLLYLGQTTHNRLQLPIMPHKELICNFRKESDTG